MGPRTRPTPNEQDGRGRVAPRFEGAPGEIALGSRSAGHLMPAIDFNDRIRRNDRYRISHWYRDRSKAR